MPPPGDHASPTASGYQPDLNACPSCFLFQSTGDRCPPARDAYYAYELAVLRMAIRAETGIKTGLADLIQLESAAKARRTLALMPGAPQRIVNQSKEKEVEYVPAGSVR